MKGADWAELGGELPLAPSLSMMPLSGAPWPTLFAWLGWSSPRHVQELAGGDRYCAMGVNGGPRETFARQHREGTRGGCWRQAIFVRLVAEGVVSGGRRLAQVCRCGLCATRV